MTVRDFPWEPPQAGSEVEHLVGALDHVHGQTAWEVAGPTVGDRGLGRRPPLGLRLRRRRSPQQLYAIWEEAVARSRARLDEALADGGLDHLVHLSTDNGRHASLRRLLCDLIEEYGRHTGHADLLREAVDGLVGEDPPAGWRASSSR